MQLCNNSESVQWTSLWSILMHATHISPRHDPQLSLSLSSKYMKSCIGTTRTNPSLIHITVNVFKQLAKGNGGRGRGENATGKFYSRGRENYNLVLMHTCRTGIIMCHCTVVMYGGFMDNSQ